MSLPHLDRTTRRVVLALLVVGGSLFRWGGAPPAAWLAGFSDLSSLLAVIVLVPVLGIPMRNGGYLEALDQWVSETSLGERGLYVVFSLVSYLVGSFIQASCIAILWDTMNSVARRVARDPFKFMLGALPRAYTACLVWAPTAPIMAACLYAAGSRWAEIFPVALPLSLFLLFLNVATEFCLGGPSGREGCQASWGMGCRERSRTLVKRAPGLRAETGSGAWRKKMGEFCVAFAGFISAVKILEGAGYEILYVVPVFALAASAIWSLCIGLGRTYYLELRRFLIDTVPGMTSQFALMVIAGFVGLAVKSSPLSAAAASVLGRMGASGAGVLIPAVTALVVGASAVGIHPFITIAIVGSCIKTGSALPSQALALTLITSSSIAFLVSPLSVTALLTSAVTGRSPLEVGLVRHWLYAVMACLASCLVIGGLYLGGIWG